MVTAGMVFPIPPVVDYYNNYWGARRSLVLYIRRRDPPCRTLLTTLRDDWGDSSGGEPKPFKRRELGGPGVKGKRNVKDRATEMCACGDSKNGRR